MSDVLIILSYTLLSVLGGDFDGCYWGCGHASRHHGAEQLLRLGPVCGGFPAQQQPADHCGRAHRLLWCYPVLHHVCGKNHVSERKGNGVLQRRMCLSFLLFTVKTTASAFILFSRTIRLYCWNTFARLLFEVLKCR